jgi:3-oxoacyl-[acyl-carrier-protein] synthase II
MTDAARETWITGIGIVSCLGEGPEAHWQRLSQPPTHVPSPHFAPFLVYPIAPIDFDKQIPKKGDQRQMEHWQRLGTYAAGLALDSAGAKGNAELLARMDMIVAAGGGERDIAVDNAIMTELAKGVSSAGYLNERLMNDLRPTLFLAQLSNLLAGNISIVHGVTGSSRTFMGEEPASIEAVRTAFARIAARQSDIVLVGGAYNAEREDCVVLYAANNYLRKGKPSGVWERAATGGGMELGSMGAFLVFEASDHARARGAKPFARVSAVVSDRAKRMPGAITAALDRMWQTIGPRVTSGRAAFMSGSTGAEPATAEERAFLLQHADLPVRATGTHIGQGPEPQFAMNIALAALALEHGNLYPPSDGSGFERAMEGGLAQVVVTCVGHWRCEGLALVEAAS